MTQELFRLILVPVDGSAQSLGAAEMALTAASGCGGRVAALHIIDEQVISDLARFGSVPAAQIERELLRNGENYLKAVQKLAEDHGSSCETHLRRGVAYKEIIAEAESSGASCILMARVGKRGPRRISIGTVAERVIEYAACPVIITPEEVSE